MLEVKTNPNSNSNFRQSLQQPRIGIRFSFFVNSFAETRQIHFHIKTIYYVLEVWTSPDFKVGLDSKFFCWWYSLHQPWIGFHFYSIFCKTELTICYVFFVSFFYLLQNFKFISYFSQSCSTGSLYLNCLRFLKNKLKLFVFGNPLLAPPSESVTY